MQPLGLNQVIGQSFNMEELANLCRALGVDIEDLGGSGKSGKARELVVHMRRYVRTDALLNMVANYHPELDLEPYLYLLIMEHFDAAAIAALCQNLSIDCSQVKLDEAGLRGYDYQTYVKEERALGLQNYMEEKGRLGELVQAIAQAKPDINLGVFEYLLDSKREEEETGSEVDSDRPTTAPKAGIVYEDFDIRIGLRRDDGRYPITAESVGGETETLLQALPMGEEEFEDLVAYLRDLIAEPEEAEQFGRELRRFLFPQSIWSLYGRSLEKAKGVGKEGLRIRLRIGLESPELSQIPWEYCRDDRSYLALNDQTPIVRYIPTNRSPEPISVPDTVRILVVMASPSDQPQLDVAEDERINEALAKLRDDGRVEVQVLYHATRAKLYDAFSHFDPHILHFSGHGMLKENGEGALVLEDDGGQSQLVDADDMLVLSQGSSVKLVVLSACETAAHAESQAIMGIAPRLVWAGIPAVVAMQFAVPDKTAVALMRYLYESLADGKPLDTAMTVARRGAYFVYDDKIFWAIPVLFMRAPDGVIWQ